MPAHHVDGIGEEVASGHLVDETLEIFLSGVARKPDDRLQLHLQNPILGLHRNAPGFELGEGREVQVLERTRFPRGHGLWIHRRDDRDGTQEQVAKALGRFDQLHDLVQTLGVMNVALRSPTVQRFLLTDEPPHVLRIDCCKAQPEGHTLGKAGAGLFLIASTRPAEGMQQHCQEQRKSPRSLDGEPSGQ